MIRSEIKKRNFLNIPLITFSVIFKVISLCNLGGVLVCHQAASPKRKLLILIFLDTYECRGIWTLDLFIKSELLCRLSYVLFTKLNGSYFCDQSSNRWAKKPIEETLVQVRQPISPGKAGNNYMESCQTHYLVVEGSSPSSVISPGKAAN